MRAAWLVVLLAGGCFDFRSLGRHDAGVDAAVALDLTVPPQTCLSPSDCAAGNNCVDGRCLAASGSCDAHKQAHAGASDGVYWINDVDGGAPPELEYCDMKQTPAADICDFKKSARVGFTRDGSNLTLSFVSVFSDKSASVCQLFAVQNQSDHVPLGIVPEDMGLLNQCQTLGFADDNAPFAGCDYGSDSADGNTNCGFTAANPAFYTWGHRIGNSLYTKYTKLGSFTGGTILTSGTIFATCKTGFTLSLDDR